MDSIIAKNPPDLLYKYVTAERIDVLKTGLIRFTQKNGLNDPFELRPDFQNVMSREQIEAIRPTEEMLLISLRKEYENLPEDKKHQMSFDDLLLKIKENPDLIERMYREIKPQTLSMAAFLTPIFKEKIRKEFAKSFGILSLSESPVDPVLWAHYSNNYSGFAYGFNTKDKFFNRRRSNNDELFHLRKVIYKNRGYIGINLADLHGTDVFLTKNPEWAYEKEWRMIVPLANTDVVNSIEEENIYLYKIPPSAISEIIFGAKTKQCLVNDAKDFILSNQEMSHIRLKKASIPDHGVSVELTDLRLP